MGDDLGFNILDLPPIRWMLFYPRSAKPANDLDGTIPVEGDVVLGYRLFLHPTTDSPLIIFFHGNGEIASDYDFAVRYFQEAGVSLLVVDYRGYGWSTGQPRARDLLSDVVAVQHELPNLLRKHGLEPRFWIVMGRSLGSAPAIHMASLYADQLKGLVIESGFAHLPPLLARMGLPAELHANLPDPIGNVRKIHQINLPLLLIHGERDTLIHISNAELLYSASPTTEKTLVRIAGAGHNDVMVSRHKYFGALGDFVQKLGKE